MDHPPLSQNPFCNPECKVCHYKDLNYFTQLKLKQNWAEQKLKNWKNVLYQIRPAPVLEQLAYRSKTWMRAFVEDHKISFGIFRSVKTEGQWTKEFVSWSDCPIHIQPIHSVIEKLSKTLTEEALDFAKTSLIGVWIGVPHLVVMTKDSFKSDLGKIHLEKLKTFPWNTILTPPFFHAWYHFNPQVGKHIFSRQPFEKLSFSIPKQDTTLSPIRAFRQISQSLLTEARTLAAETLLQTQPLLILDLYCGTGELALHLPPHVHWIGIELSNEAAKFAQSQRSQTTAIHQAYTGKVEQRLQDPQVLKQIIQPYAIYLNPPRSGLSSEARNSICKLVKQKSPNCIVYLSCSASSLAKDLTWFELLGFQVSSLRPYDFFPQTEHFETLCILHRNLSL